MNVAARTLAELGDLPPTIDVPTAGQFLGLDRTASYDLVRRGEWPTPVIRLGHLVRVPSAALVSLLGFAPTTKGSSQLHQRRNRARVFASPGPVQCRAEQPEVGATGHDRTHASADDGASGRRSAGTASTSSRTLSRFRPVADGCPRRRPVCRLTYWYGIRR